MASAKQITFRMGTVEMELTYRLPFKTCQQALVNAGLYFRKKYKVTNDEVVLHIVERECSIKAIFNPDDYHGHEIRSIEFKNELEAIAFLLRWQ